MAACASCGGDNYASAKFCGECGAGLTIACEMCKAAIAPGRSVTAPAV